MKNGEIDKVKTGRPLKFKDREELQKNIDEYFSWCDSRTKTIFDPKTNKEILIVHPAPYTMSGLARKLGISRQALSEYAHRDSFGDAIIEARSKVQEDIETRLMETRNEKGAIFNLVNNFGWKKDRDSIGMEFKNGENTVRFIVTRGNAQ